MIQRNTEQTLLVQLIQPDEHPNVILLEGARQVGKSTLTAALRPKLAGLKGFGSETAPLYTVN